MSTVVDELITLLGLELDPAAEGEGNRLKSVLSSVRTVALAVGAAIITGATAATALAAKFAQTTDQGAKFADSINVQYEALQELEFATKRAGGSADELRGDLLKLSQTLSSPIPGEFNQSLYMLGISARDSMGQLKSSDKVLEDIVKKFESFDKVKQQQWGSKLGLSQSTIKLIQQGSGGLAELRQRARELGGIIPANVARDAANFNDAMTDTKTAISGVVNVVAAALLPILIEAGRGMADWIAVNRVAISSSLVKFIDAAAEGLGDFVDIVRTVSAFVMSAINPLLDFAGGFELIDLIAPAVTAALIALTAVLGVFVIQMLIAAAPILAIAAAIGLAVIAIEDLYIYLNGGDSLIGRFFDAFEQRFPGLFGKIKDLVSMWAGIAEAIIYVAGIAYDAGVKIKEYFTWWFEVLTPTRETLDQIGSVLSGLAAKAEPFIAAANRIHDAVKPILDTLNGMLALMPMFSGFKLDDVVGDLTSNEPSFTGFIKHMLTGGDGEKNNQIPMGAEGVGERNKKDGNFSINAINAIQSVARVAPVAANMQQGGVTAQSVPVPASVVNNVSRTSNQGGNTVQMTVNGDQSSRAFAAEVAGRVSQGLGTTTQMLTPGNRAPLVS